MSEQHTPLTFGIAADAYPLLEKIVLRSGIALFESQLSLITPSSPDCAFLSNITFGACYAGASDGPIYPFVCAPNSPLTGLPTGAEVLAQFPIANFQTEHITDFDSTQMPYPGYHPGSRNDEIHTDPNKQYMFAVEAVGKEQAESPNELEALSRASHAALRGYVLNQHLFYLLIHDKPQQHGEFLLSDLVLLFAVGVSPATGHFVGAVSSQVCHNLCD